MDRVGPESSRPLRVRAIRMEAFSDDVFAIAITLLVLEIGLPAGASEDLLRAIVDSGPHTSRTW